MERVSPIDVVVVRDAGETGGGGTSTGETRRDAGRTDIGKVVSARGTVSQTLSD